MTLKEVKNLTNKIKIKKFIKEGIIGEPFEVCGKPCVFSSKSEKPNILLGKDWHEYENISELKKAEREYEFNKTINTPNIDVDSLFEKLVFVGEKGLDLIEGKVNNLKNKLFKTVRSSVQTKLDFAIWSGLPQSGPNKPGLRIGDKVYNNIDNIGVDYHDNVELQRALEYLLELAAKIPTYEVWNGGILFTDYSIKKDDDTFIIKVDDDTSYLSDSSVLDNKCCGIVFNQVLKPDGTQILDIDLSQLTDVPESYCLLTTTLQPKNAEINLSEIQMYMTSFENLKEKLSSDPVYTELVENTAFRRFMNFSESTVANEDEISFDFLVKQLNLEIVKEQDRLESADFNEAYKLIRKDPIITDWSNKLTALEKILDEHSDTVLNVVTMYNVLINLKWNLWQLFDSKTKLTEATVGFTKVRQGENSIVLMRK